MELILKFGDEDGEEQYMNALNGWKYKAILYELTQLLRSYEKGWNIESEFSTETVRDFLSEKMDKYAVGL
jgi:hypothetical protein